MSAARTPRRRQGGLTLVEIMVAMALSLVVALAALAALVVSKRGFASVDAASELRDNARFGASMLQRITSQAGFMDYRFAMINRIAGQDLVDPPPAVQGFNNAVLPASSPFNPATNPLATAAHSSRTATSCTSQEGQGCSDVLVVRYQAQLVPGAALPGSAPISDRSMIDCSGQPVEEVPATRDDQSISIFYVALHRDEPTLMCMSGRQTAANGLLGSTWQAPVPVISGVENFQVLYGADGARPGAAPTASATSVPGRYLRADQMDGNDAAATNQNWRRVRSVRIGMVLRGPVGSQQGADNAVTLYPFGRALSASGAAPGSALSSADDRGSAYALTNPGDNRLRQTLTFTVYLHNDQGLCLGKSCAVQ